MNINLALLSTGLVCIFYTTLGGMKGVIITDVFMSVWMVAGLFAVTIKGKELKISFEYFCSVWLNLA